MNGFMGMGWLGWMVSLVIGFVIGGFFFFSIKLQVEYVVRKRGADWVLPAAMYARLVLVAVILILVAVSLPGEKVPGAMLGGVAGAMLARWLVARTVRHGPRPSTDGGDSTEADKE